MKHISDPLYEYITVSDEELEIINTPTVQRLRRVHQLGLSSVVYPSATHTRFVHSLGVMHLSGKIAEALGLSDDEIQAYRLGGLLHDIGHAPFSHSTEYLMERQLGFDHEENSCRLVKEELAPLLPVDAELIVDIIKGESKYDIVHGDVDADRLDYLPRDSLMSGIPHGEIDVGTLIRFCEIRDGRIVFSAKCIQSLEGMFSARFQMRNSVYEHHACKIAEAMLRRSISTYLREEGLTMMDIVGEDDYQVHSRLTGSDGVGAEIYTKVANRELYKRAVYLTELQLTREELLALRDLVTDTGEAETLIAEMVGIEPHLVIVEPPITPRDKALDVHILLGDEVIPFSEVSPASKTYNDNEWRTTTFGVYTLEEHVHDVREAIKELTLIGL